MLRPYLRTCALSAAILTFAAVAVPVSAQGAVEGTAPDVVINEVVSTGDEYDWVELYNPTDAAVDISGLQVTDDKGLERELFLPEGSTIGAGGFFAVDVDDDATWGDASFGFGNGDEARLYWDGELIDSFVYDAHANTSWGACPDGSHEYAVTAESTKNAANVCDADAAASLVVNEVESSGGDPDDWVEIYNTAETAVDASGLVFRDDDDEHGYTIPDGTTVAAEGYLVLEKAQFGFGLGSEDEARLFEVDGVTLIDEYSWTDHADETYGRCPDGIGAFADTDAPTKGTANQCAAPAGYDDDVVINEVESSGGTPGDWVELYNTGDSGVDLTGWVVRDSNDDHEVVLPAGASIESGGFYVVDTDATEDGFGLGDSDQARVFLADGETLVAEYSWDSHAATTYGRCPDGTGAFVETFQDTRGAANDCSPLRINEVVSKGGEPGDWIELVNIGDQSVDASGYVLRDDKDEDAFVLPAGTVLAAGGYYVADVESAFGLGGSDSARLFAVDGTTLLDAYTWSDHASTSWARCPDGTGEFALSASVTRGEANDCIGLVDVTAWPGPDEVSVVDVADRFGEDMSGLAYEGTGTGERGTLWAVNNGSGSLFALAWDGEVWDTGREWTLRYPDGTGAVDAEGVGFTDAGPDGGVYVATERDNDSSSVSRPSVLRYEPTGSGGELSATDEWNLSEFVGVIGANAGLEGIAWIDDDTLVADGFVDESTGAAYDPADYADHGDGVFFVGVEGTGHVYAVTLPAGGEPSLVAEIDPGLPMVAELEYDATTDQLWALCDEVCDGQAALLQVDQDGARAGSFVQTAAYENPADMGDGIANEGFAIGSMDLCVDSVRPVFYADDAENDGHALREAALECESDDETEPITSPTTEPTSAPTTAPGSSDETPDAPAEADISAVTEDLISGPETAVPGQSVTITVGTAYANQTVYGWIFSTPISLGSATVASDGTVTFTIPAGIDPGVHRIVVTDADGQIIGWYALTVTDDLAATGGQIAPVVPVALVLLLAGGGLVIARRARRTA